MDKTGWIVVSACAGILAWNFLSDKKETPPAAPAPTNATAAAPTAPSAASAPAPATATAPKATAGSATAPTPAPAPAAQAQAPVSLHFEPKEIASLSSYDGSGKPVVRYVFQNKGGSIKYAEMVGKAINSTKPELQQAVRLNEAFNQGIGTFMFGLSESADAFYDESEYTLKSADASKVVLEGKIVPAGSSGYLAITKTYQLRPVKEGDSAAKEGRAYVLNLEVKLENRTAGDLKTVNWGLFTGLAAPISKTEGSPYINYVLLEDKSFDNYGLGEFSNWFSADYKRIYNNEALNLSWAGGMSQYYATLVKPLEGTTSSSYYTQPVKVKLPVTHDASEAIAVGIGMPVVGIAANTGSAIMSYDIFTGPKLNTVLNDLSDEYYKIDEIMDYGWLSFLSYPMNWLINVFHNWFGNWGWAIVCMTLVVRTLIWPLYRKSYMSMKRMSLLQPQIKELKEKYPNDQQKVSMEMMGLYRKYGISPVGGCLPMLLQIPIFFAFFYVLQTAAEFRGAPFIGWVTDLSQMDTVASIPLGSWSIPINVLPFLMVITMILQMRMTPAAGDPMQQKIMKFMPLLFFVFCYTYPSALALYWTTQNIITIIQTWIITRMPMPELTLAPKKSGGKKGFFQRMMEAQQAAQAEQQKRQGKSGNMRNVTRK